MAGSAFNKLIINLIINFMTHFKLFILSWSLTD